MMPAALIAAQLANINNVTLENINNSYFNCWCGLFMRDSVIVNNRHINRIYSTKSTQNTEQKSTEQNLHRTT